MSLSIETGAQSDQTVVIALRGEADYTRPAVPRSGHGGTRRWPRPGARRSTWPGCRSVDSTGVGVARGRSPICAEFGVRLLLRDVEPVHRAGCSRVLGVSDMLGVPAPAGVVAPRLGRRAATTWRRPALAQPA